VSGRKRYRIEGAYSFDRDVSGGLWEKVGCFAALKEMVSKVMTMPSSGGIEEI
jgi:hypothetical protein